MLIRSTLLLIIVSFNALAKEGPCIVRDDLLVDTSNTLKNIEQESLTEGQCRKFFRYSDRHGVLKEKWKNNPKAKEAQVLCGKWMFFNLGMRTKVGIPVKLLNEIKKFSGVGKRLEGLGFLDDKSWSDRGYPFGVVPARTGVSFKKISVGKMVQISCVACHSASLPDGRVSVGAANQNLDIGKFNLYALYSIWLADARRLDYERWDKDLVKHYIEHYQTAKDFKFMKKIEKTSTMNYNDFFLKKIIGEEPPPLATQRSLLKSRPGVFNGFTPIINFSDRELYVSTPQIWEIGNEKPVHYGSLAGIKDIDDFIREAVAITTRIKKYSKKGKFITPLREYMKCLKTPKNPQMVKVSKSYQQGQKSFEKNCISCHDLNSGASSKAYDFSELGTPLVFKNLFEGYKPQDVQSKKAYKVFEKVGISNMMTDQIRSRRLNGIWTRSHLTSNGAIKDLDHLFCLNGKTRKDSDSSLPLTEGIHLDLCKDYSESERKELKSFLLGF